MKAIANSGQNIPKTGEMFLHKFQRRGAFIAHLPFYKRKMMIKKFITPLGAGSRFFHRDFVNLCIM
jgi:hypothetical protein